MIKRPPAAKKRAQRATERRLTPSLRKKREQIVVNPAYVYLKEAHDYIAKLEARIRELESARSRLER